MLTLSIAINAQVPVKTQNSNHHPTLQVTDANGQLQPLDLSALQATVNRAAEGLEGIDVQAIIDETVKTYITA